MADAVQEQLVIEAVFKDSMSKEISAAIQDAQRALGPLQADIERGFGTAGVASADEFSRGATQALEAVRVEAERIGPAMEQSIVGPAARAQSSVEGASAKMVDELARVAEQATVVGADIERGLVDVGVSSSDKFGRSATRAFEAVRAGAASIGPAIEQSITDPLRRAEGEAKDVAAAIVASLQDVRTGAQSVVPGGTGANFLPFTAPRGPSFRMLQSTGLEIPRESIEDTQRALGLFVSQSERAASRVLGSFGPAGRAVDQFARSTGLGALGLEKIATASGLSATGLTLVAGTATGVAAAGGAVAYLTYQTLQLDRALGPAVLRMGATANEARRLRSEVRDLAFETGKSTDVIAGAVTSSAVAGIPRAQRNRFVEIAADASELGLGTPAQSGERLSKLAAAFDIDTSNVEKFFEILSQLRVLSQDANVPIDSFTDSITQLGGTVSAIGFEFPDFARVFAASARDLKSAESAARGLNTLLLILGDRENPTNTQIRALPGGVDLSAEALRARQATGTVADIKAAVGDDQELLIRLFGSARTAQSAFALFKAGADEAADADRRFANAVEDTSRILDDFSGQTSQKVERSYNRISTTVGRVGDVGEKAISPLVDMLDSLLSVGERPFGESIERFFRGAARFNVNALTGGAALFTGQPIPSFDEAAAARASQTSDRATGGSLAAGVSAEREAIRQQVVDALQSQDFQRAIDLTSPFERAAIESSQAYADRLNIEIQKRLDDSQVRVPAAAILLDPELAPKLSAQMRATLEKAAKFQDFAPGLVQLAGGSPTLDVFKRDLREGRLRGERSDSDSPDAPQALDAFVSSQAVDRVEFLNDASRSIRSQVIETAEGMKRFLGFAQEGGAAVASFKPIEIVVAPQDLSKAQRELDRLLGQIQPTAVEVPVAFVGLTRVSLEPQEVQTARATEERLSTRRESDLTPQDKKDLENATDIVRRYQAAQKESIDLAAEFAARQSDGIERIARENAVLEAQAQARIDAAKLETNDVLALARAQSELNKLREFNAGRLEEAKSRAEVQARLSSLGIEQKIAEERVKAARLLNDSLGGNAAEADLLRIKAELLGESAAAQSRAASEGARGNAAITSEIERQNRLREEAARLEGQNLALARERLEVDRQRSVQAELQTAQDESLRGLDAELARIVRIATEQKRVIEDRLKLASSDPKSLRPDEGRQLVEAVDDTANAANKLATLEAQREVLDAILGQARSLAVVGADQYAIENATLIIEAQRVGERLALANAAQAEIEAAAKLFDLQQKQLFIDRAFTSAQVDPAARGEAELLAAALDRVNARFPEGERLSAAYGRALEAEFLRARSGAEAAAAGTAAGIELIRRKLDDDFGQSIDAAVRRWDTFEQGGLSAFRSLLEGQKTLGEALGDMLKEQAFVELEERFVKPALRGVGKAFFGVPTPQGEDPGLSAGSINDILRDGLVVPADHLILAGDSLLQAASALSAISPGVASPIAGGFEFGSSEIPAADFVGPPTAEQSNLVGPPEANASGEAGAQFSDEVGFAGASFSAAAQAGGRALLLGGQGAAGFLEAAGGTFLSSLIGAFGSAAGGGLLSAIGIPLPLAHGAVISGETKRSRVHRFAAGGISEGRSSGPRSTAGLPFERAAGGGLYDDTTYLQVAEIAGLRELVAPLQSDGSLQAEFKNGQMVVRVPSGAQVPLSFKGEGKGAAFSPPAAAGALPDFFARTDNAVAGLGQGNGLDADAGKFRDFFAQPPISFPLGRGGVSPQVQGGDPGPDLSRISLGYTGGSQRASDREGVPALDALTLQSAGRSFGAPERVSGEREPQRQQEASADSARVHSVQRDGAGGMTVHIHASPQITIQGGSNTAAQIAAALSSELRKLPDQLAAELRGNGAQGLKDAVRFVVSRG